MAQGIPCNGEESNGNFSLSVELFAENIGELTDFQGNVTDLTGYNTYRVYLNTEGPLDKLSAVYGDDSRPLSISSTQPFRQTPLFPGASNALVNVNNAVLFPTFPEILYDSYLTIGIDQAHDPLAGQSAISIVEDAAAPFAAGFGLGGDILVNTNVGGAWYIDDADLYTNGDAGAGQKVLVAQLTTQGEITGDLAMQIFRDGEANSENCIRPYLSFQSHGCTDASACNYTPTAIIDDGTCDFCSCPDSVQVLSANFPQADSLQYSLEVDIIADHDTTGIATNVLGAVDPLSGMKTYRLYAKVDNPGTKVNACYGTPDQPLNITSTAPFYHSLFGGITPSNISPSLWTIPTYADNQYDSWVTIGIDRIANSMPAPGYDMVNIAGNWQATFDPGGGNLVANGEGAEGAIWFAVPTTQNVVPDADLRILLAQFTTAGTVEGTLGMQIIPDGAAQGEDIELPFYFSTDGLGGYVDVVPDICDCINVDLDYFCDEEDNCTDLNACNYNDEANGPCQVLDECGVCGGNGIPAGDCDCNGNQLDALDVCGGTCAADVDNNGTCDDSEILGCMDPTADNYNPNATQDDGGCQYLGCTDSSAQNFDPNANVDDGSCQFPGCTDPDAWNYDSTANFDDGSCQANACGVDGPLIVATNFDFTPSSLAIATGTTVIWQNESTSLHNVNGDVSTLTGESFGNPVAFSLPGNFGNLNGTCMGTITFDVPGVYQYDCSIGAHAQLGMVATITVGVGGCPDASATNFDPLAEFNDGSCSFAGCTDASACNYDAGANVDDGSCTFATGCETCSGETDGTGTVVDNDADNDGVCDANEIQGCTDASSCNYDADPTTDTNNTLCVYATGCETCSGETDGTGTVVDNDADNDGVCDANEVTGCTDPTACNYDADPTTDTDNTLCTYVDGICETCENGLIVDNDADNDGVCDANEVTGCTDATACNYDADPTTDTDNTLCTYVDGICETCENGLIIDNDTDNDGVCDAAEIPGCQDATACNYNASATDSDGNCVFVDGICETCSGQTDGTGTVVDNDQDDDGVCDADEIEGCTDASACNYDATPTTDTNNTLCVYPTGCETCSG
ncbi:MAG: plastocyanin/azurin family copper-binding protein, partial [Flavobacteriales bacterium]